MVEKNPNSLIMPLLDWVIDFDCQKTAENNYDRIALEVKSGKDGSIEDLSLPAGGSYDSMGIKEEDNKAAALQKEVKSLEQ